MLRLSTENATTSDTGVELDQYTERLKQIRQDKTYQGYESSLCLVDDEQLLEEVSAMANKKVTPSLKYTIVVGIGGSNLGTKAVYDALLGYADLMDPQRFPKLLFAETTDPELLSRLASLIETLSSPEEVLVLVISKSGGTTETMANFEIIMGVLQQKFADARDRVVAITDKDSKLMNAAADKGVSYLTMPSPVGGRFSVFSAVGLLPLMSVGVDIHQLRAGASVMLDECFSGPNLAAQSAVALASSLKNGHTINDNFFFHPELESVGKWYRQLMGESVGKEKSLQGEVVHTGITPTVSLGSTDLHSVGQLYLGGPRDKITTFVVSAQSVQVPIPTERFFADLVPMIAGKSADGIMQAIFEGVKAAYRNEELPFMEVTLDAIDERSIGAFLQFKMLEMMYLGQLLNVNTFDQPSVESYKIETKRLLEQ